MLTGLKLSNTSKSKGTVVIHIRTIPLGFSLTTRCSYWFREYRLEVLPSLHWCYVDHHRCNLVEVSRGEVLRFSAYWTLCCKRLTPPTSQTKMMSLEDIGALFENSTEALGKTKNAKVRPNSSGEDIEKDNTQTQIEDVQP